MPESNTVRGNQNGAKGIVQRVWQTVEGAPPLDRNFDISFVVLARKRGEVLEPVGAYVAELKNLAKLGRLKVQAKAQDLIGKKVEPNDAEKLAAYPKLLQALFRPSEKMEYTKNEKGELVPAGGYIPGKSGVFILKTPDELALLPFTHNGPVQKAVQEEFKFQNLRGWAWPAQVSKNDTLQAYLANIGQVGLIATDLENNTFMLNSIKGTIKNPPLKASLKEKLFHYLGQWVAEIAALGAAIGAVEWISLASGPITLLMASQAIAFVVGTWVATWCAQQFSKYDMAEELNRVLGWLLDKELALGEWKDFSVTNALKASFYTAGNGLLTYLTITGVFAVTMALPWASLGYLGLSAGMIQGFAAVVSGILAAVAGVGAFLGVAFTQRYFWGLSLWNNQASFTQEAVDALPVVNIDKDARGRFARAKQRPMPGMRKVVGTWEPETQKLHQEMFDEVFDIDKWTQMNEMYKLKAKSKVEPLVPVKQKAQEKPEELVKSGKEASSSLRQSANTVNLVADKGDNNIRNRLRSHR